MNKLHEERDRLAVRCFHNLPPEMAEPRILGFRFGFDAATEIHQKRIERLREALQKCARANDRNPYRGTGGPEYCLSRIDIKAFAEIALQEDGK